MYHFIDHPSPKKPESYHEAIRQIVATNSILPSLIAIYKFGNITSPGISDLDILFVFENKASCSLNGFEGLDPNLKNIFTHGIMAVSEDFFREMDFYALWGEKELLYGKEIVCNRKRSDSEEEVLKRQTAKEFLLANYVDLQVQLTYKTIKIRSFLQHMKGLAYDLEYLGDFSNPLHEPIETIKEKIMHWFEQKPGNDFIENWIRNFTPMYFDYLNKLFINSPIQLPSLTKYNIATNMELINGNEISLIHKGIRLPASLSIMGKKFFKIQHRLNQFTFTCPIGQCEDSFLKNRFEFIKSMKHYNRSHLPAFMTNTTSITSKIF